MNAVETLEDRVAPASLMLAIGDGATVNVLSETSYIGLNVGGVADVNLLGDSADVSVTGGDAVDVWADGEFDSLAIELGNNAEVYIEGGNDNDPADVVDLVLADNANVTIEDESQTISGTLGNDSVFSLIEAEAGPSQQAMDGFFARLELFVPLGFDFDFDLHLTRV